MTLLLAIWHSTVLHHGLVGLAGAVIPDVHQFLRWKTLDDAKTFSAKVALLHYAQGFVGGVIATPVVSAIFGAV